MYDTRWVFSTVIFIVALFCWRCSLFASAQRLVTHPDEVRALGAIKGRLDDSVLRNLSNWNRGDPCLSNWTGVLCYNSTMDDGYLHVVELQLLKMQLSGSMSPELGKLTLMKRLNLMWNRISGRIPNEIGNITALELLLLNGNQITGSLPEEIGFLPVLDRIQIDQNLISGPLPVSFSNLLKTRHFHMNNNSISGQIPPELSKLPRLVHMLLDNNNLTGYLPPELSEIKSLRIIQLDNNNFGGTTIPSSYSNMTKLLKMSLRNCNLEGSIPDMSRIPTLAYLDLSSNKLSGSIPDVKLSDNITTIDLSNNELTGTIPRMFSGLPNLQILSLANNSLNGSIPSSVFQGWKFNGSGLTLDLQNNQLSSISGGLNLPLNITLWLQGNPICSDMNLTQFCKSRFEDENDVQQPNNTVSVCPARCPPPYEYPPDSPISCFCAAPIGVEYRLKSPGFWDFIPYLARFESYMTSGLDLYLYQLDVFSFQWQEGPRLAMQLKFFPTYDPNSTDSNVFNKSELDRIKSMFTQWEIADSDIFGPYELLGFNLSDLYKDEILAPSESRLSSLQVIGIVIGAVITAVVITAIVSAFVLRKRFMRTDALGRRRYFSKLSIKIDGVREFKHEELRLATNGFHQSTEVGQGGYGKVYRGLLSDGVAVAIKCAQEGSLQGEKEFFTEIELLSRLHHRNLVSLIGFCVQQGQQMLVYEFMSNGTLRDHLSAKSGKYPTFTMRLRIALASAKGILYLHTEANPPIFHRDIKATNILLDSNFTAKVADFGLSRLAPLPEIEGAAPAYVSTVVKGTPGYLDPEYFLTHKLTDKSDVYSLGVVFLELLTGRPPIWRGKNIVRDVNVAYKSGEMLKVIDENIGSYPLECADKMFKLALKCCQEETDMRPSMKEVVRTLEDLTHMLPDSDEDTEQASGEPGKTMMTPLFSSTSYRNITSSSGDFSGSALVSGAVPMIAPR